MKTDYNTSFELRITYNKNASALECELLKETICLEQESLVISEAEDENTLFIWLNKTLRPFLYGDHFATANLTLTVLSPEISTSLAPLLQHILYSVKNTQDFIKKYSYLKTQIESFDGLLFYNVDDLNTFGDLYNNIKEMNPQKTHYLNMSSGWNKKMRAWENPDLLDTETLLQTIISKKTRHIFTVNMYYLTLSLQHHKIYTLCLLKALGIEWITIDYDTYEQNRSGYFLKHFFNELSFRRFSIMPNISSHWDEVYKNSNVQYFYIGNVKLQEPKIHQLETNYQTVVASHARLDEAIQFLTPALFYLQHLPIETLFLDLQRTYYALTYFLLKESNFDIQKKGVLFSLFSKVYLHSNSILKYEIIQSLLDHQLPIKIYGDQNWKYIFPEQYQDKFLSEQEMTDLFQEKKSIYLLMNQNYSYFENNPVFLRAVNESVPYLIFTPVVRSRKLKGLEALEYRNTPELASKINNINALTMSQSYQESLGYFKEKIIASNDNFHERILSPQLHISDFFSRICKDQEEGGIQDLICYIQTHKDRLIFIYNALISNTGMHFSIQNSKFFHRPYMAKMIDYSSKPKI